MKEKICLFAGTSEGRKLAAALAGEYELFVCVATEYGELLLDGTEGINVHTGRMDEAEMEDFFAGHGFARIIDATHPFAAEATKNIRAAAEAKGIPCLRILRESDAKRGNAVYLGSVREAAEYLEKTTGNVLVTTGAKEIGAYSPLGAERVWA
ncbi:MAG: precorrin-6A/cobalt-precorrin-6A reductase, partial [Clostridia bacterium]|nr:precorrin-6A/cobalt-precorrin-6A reductase [Clostridia bacterium]